MCQKTRLFVGTTQGTDSNTFRFGKYHIRMDLKPIEFKCECGAECRLHCEAIPSGSVAGMPLGGVQHCSEGKGIMPGGIPTSLDVKRDGKWIEYTRY